MSKNTVSQVNNTRNQSTALFTADKVFLGNNDYDPITLTNAAAGAQVTLESGMLLYKTAAGVVDVNPAAANIANVVGILRMDSNVDLADAGSLAVNMAIRGDIAEEMLVLGTANLDTLIPTTQRTLRDHLNGLGFHLVAGVENTKFDNT